jgi:putative iron-only hydrogenase system regulator
MEKRIGAAIILVENKDSVEQMNEILSAHLSIILGRQGLPLRDKDINIINLVLEATPEEIGSLTGKIGAYKVPVVGILKIGGTSA